MKVDKGTILDLLRVRGEDIHATAAERELPDPVDTDRDRALLERFGLDEQAIRGGLDDASGGLGDRPVL
ncbi:hypothetical protein [Actinotalea solisilvae]|uniref:hypothetical protein n=1 Tax=Actinotalea solisilvae TaxID=2072922 RepID=UPI0018F210B6|nr:hypothetical protein [Actinotalea solisilvae]